MPVYTHTHTHPSTLIDITEGVVVSYFQDFDEEFQKAADQPFWCYEYVFRTIQKYANRYRVWTVATQWQILSGQVLTCHWKYRKGKEYSLRQLLRWCASSVILVGGFWEILTLRYKDVLVTFKLIAKATNIKTEAKA